MELKEKSLPREKKSIILRIIYSATILGMYAFKGEILTALHIELPYGCFVNFVLGGLFVQSLYAVIASLTRPRTRVCDHFVIDNYDGNVISWDLVKKVRVRKDWLTLIMPEGRLWKEYTITLQWISDKEEFVNYIEKICTSREIPFEKS